MIDLHAHVLPAVDDGPADLAGSLALLRAMASEGVRTVVATPHVSDEYPTTAEQMRTGVERLRHAAGAAGIDIEVLPGAEITIGRAAGMDDADLRELVLGGGEGRLLVESPLSASAGDFDWILAGLRARGFALVLAHPERCPAFQREPGRLAANVAAGDVCSITAGAMAGRFGSAVRRFTVRLLAEGLVHDVASDAHDLSGRPPGLLEGFDALERELPGIGAHATWHTREVPRAILAGTRMPLPPPMLERRAPARRRWRRRG